MYTKGANIISKKISTITRVFVYSVLCATLVLSFFTGEATATGIEQYRGGLLVYSDGSTGVPKYKIFNDATGFGAEQSATAVGASAIEWIRVAASPVKDEWIIVTRDAADDIIAQVCVGIEDGVSCGATTTITATAGTHGFRNYDVAYEQLTGDALVVYGTATADELRKIEWTGGAWTSDAAITTTRTSGTVEWVELTSRNASNQIAIGYADTNDDVSAYRWSGTAVGDEATAVITATASIADVRKFDVSFEGSSGDMIVAAPDATAGTTHLGHMTAAGVWTIVANTEPDNVTAFIDLQEPGPVDYVAMVAHGSTTSNNPTEGYTLNGSTPNTTTTGMVDGTVAVDTTTTVWSANYMMSSVSYLSTTYYAVAAFSDVTGADDINWWTMNSSGVWTAQTDNTRSRGTTRFTELVDYPNADKVLLLSSDANSDLWADTWDGAATGASAWTDLTSGGALETALVSGTTNVFDFAFRLASGTISGVLYADDGRTADASGQTIKLMVGTSTPSVHSTTTTTGGVWTFTGINLTSVASTTPLTIWLDASTTKATTIVSDFSTTTGLAGVPLYRNTFMTYGANPTSTINLANFYVYDSSDDTDILYTITSTSTGTSTSHFINRQGSFIPTSTFNLVGDYTNNGTFVGAGANWTARSAAGDDDAWRDVTYANGLFVAVGTSGDRVMTSPDGITWTVRTPPVTASWYGVTYGNGLYVVVSSGGEIITSPDAITWTQRTSPSDALLDVAYGNGMFVAVGWTGQTAISRDGVDWQLASAVTATWYGITFGGGQFVAVAYGGTNRVQTSPDGITWTAQSIAGDTGTWLSVAYGNNTYVAVGGYLENAQKVATSPDGITWTTQSVSGNNDIWWDVEYCNGLFMAVGTSTSHNIITSPDGVSWTEHASPYDVTGQRDVTCGNGVTVSVSQTGTFRAMTSHDSHLIFSSTSPQMLQGNLSAASQLRAVTFNGSSTNNVVGTTEGLLGHWTFENSEVTWTSASAGTVNDVSGNGYHGTIASMSSSTSPVTGRNGKAFDFDAVDDAITIDAARENDFNPGTTSFSVATWVKPDNVNQTGAFIAKRRSGGNFERWWLGACATTSCTAGKRIYFSNVGATAGTSRILITNADVVDGNWHHVVGVTDADSQTLKIYVDGVEAAATLTSAGAWPNVTHTSPVQIGASTAGSFKLNGAVDDARYYNRALSATEVLALYNERPKVFSDNASTTNLTNNSGLMAAPKALHIAGDYTNSDTFRAGIGTTTFSGNLPQALSGNMTGTSSFFSVNFSDDGSKTFESNASTTHMLVATSSGEVITPDGLTIEGNYTNQNLVTQAGAVWATTSVAGNNDNWNRVIYAGGQFVAVGVLGDRIMTSPDGITWTTRTSPEANSWRDIAYGNGLYVAVSNTGTNRVMYSTDGITWATTSAAEANQWYALAYGNGKFVAVSRDGTNRVMYSTDGITWATTSAASASEWWGITYGEGLFVAVTTTDGANQVMTSPDGITWTARATTGINGDWNAVTHGNGRFVAVGYNNDLVMWSDDGITWATSSVMGDDNWWDVTYGGGLFAAIGTSSVHTNLIMTSPDGITWTPRTVPYGGDSWYGIAYGAGRFVGVGYAGTNRVMISNDTDTYFTGTTSQTIAGNLAGASQLRSVTLSEVGTKTFLDNASTTNLIVATSSGEVIMPDALSVSGDYYNNSTTTMAAAIWSSSTPSQDNNWHSVAYGNGLFVAVSDTGTNRVMTSPDGVTWTNRTASGTNAWRGVTFGNGMFVAVGNSGSVHRVMVSYDGINWEAVTATSTAGWWSVTYGEGLFVAVGGTCPVSCVMTSPDGRNWTPRNTPEDNSWYDVAYGNGIFVAVASNGTNRIMRSLDGVTWTTVDNYAASWRTITYGNGRFVALADNGTVMYYSSDGITWASSTVSEASDWVASAYGNGLFVAVAYGGTNRVMTSPDGINWTSRAATGNDDYWQNITYGNGIFVAVGTSSTDRVMTSRDTLTYFNGTDSQTISGNLVGASQLRSVTLSDAGTKTFSDNASTTNFIVATSSGEVITPESIVISGDYTNSGVVTQRGAVWATTSAAENDDTWSDVIYAEDLFVAVAYTGDDRVMTSPDGITWTTQSAAGNNDGWNEIAYGNGRFVAVSCGASCGSAGDVVMYSDDAITWATTSAAGNDDDWFAVTYGNGIFVAGAISGDTRIMTSSDGITWTPRSVLGNNDGWSSIVYGGGQFVAVARSGDHRVMTSPDGVTWTAQSALGNNDSWNSVTYGNGVYVASGFSGDRLMSSPDGVTWTARTFPDSSDFTGVVRYLDGVFYALNGGSARRLATSLDGINWTTRSVAGDNDSWAHPAYGNGTLVAIGLGGTDRAMYSILSTTTFSGASTQNISGNLSATSTLGNVAFDGVGSKTFGHNASTTNFIVASTSGEVVTPNSLTVFDDYQNSGTVTQAGAVWATTSATESNIWYGATYGNGRFVAVSSNGTNQVMYSDDGVTWATASAANTSLWYAVTYGNGLFVAVAYSGAGQRVMTSPDGINWTGRDATEANNWFGVTYGNGRFVAVSSDGTNRVMYSDDGITWATASAAAASGWQSVTFGNGRYVAVADTGTDRVMYSDDGVTWATSSAAEANNWYSVTYGGGLFVAVAYTGTNRLMTSPDGVTWTARSVADSDHTWQSVTYGGGLFVAVACGSNSDGVCNTTTGSHRIITSPDGINWTGRDVPEEVHLRTAVYGENQFVVITRAGGRVMISKDTSMYMSGATEQTISGNLIGASQLRSVTFSDTGTKTFSDNASTTNFAISASSTVVAPTLLTIHGDYQNSGTFTAGSGTTTLGGSTAQTATGTMIGTSAFNNLVVANTHTSTSTTFGANLDVSGHFTNRIAGSKIAFVPGITATSSTLTLVGSTSAPIYLRSTAGGSQWNIVAESSYTIAYVDVQDSNACGSTGGWINAGETSVDSGNTICWSFTVGGGDTITVTGVLYEADRVTPYATSTTVKLNVATSTANTFTTNTTAGTGAFSFSVAIGGSMPTSTPVTVFANGSAVITAVTVTKSNGSTTIANLPLYKDHIIVKNETVGTTTKVSDLIYYDSTDDADVLFTASSTLSTFATVGTPTLLVASGTTFQLDYPTTAHTLEIATTSVVLASSTLTLSGNYQNNGAFYAGISTTTLSGTSAQTIGGVATGSSAFNHMVFAGAGTKTFSTTEASTTNFIIESTSGAVTAPLKLSVSGNYTNNAVFTAGSGTTTFNGTSAQNASGTMTGASAFNNLTFSNSGAKTLATNASTTNFIVNTGSGEVITPPALTVSGNYTNNSTTTMAGAQWTRRSASGGGFDYWKALTYGNGRFVAVNYSGSDDNFMTSTDGITWTGNFSINGWYGVTYGNGLFVAVGSGANRVMTSPDGVTWTQRSPVGNNDVWYGVTYGNGLFVAVGDSTGSGDSVMYSTDGITWATTTAAGDNDYWTAVTYGNGLFVAVGDSTGSGDSVMTSPDGINWTARSAVGDDDDWQSVTYGNGLFVAVGDSTGSGDSVMTSPDGINWTARSAAGDNDDWQSVTYGNGLFVAVGSFVVMTSPDGINWTARSATGDDDYWTAVTYGNNMFVAVGLWGDDRVMTSYVSTTTFSSASAQNFSGSLTGGSAFGNVAMTGSSTKTFAAHASTSNLIVAASSTVVAPNSLTIYGDYVNSGTFTAGSGTTTLAGSVAQTATGTMTGASAFNNLRVANTHTSTSTTFGANFTVTGHLSNNVAGSRMTFVPGITATAGTLALTGSSSAPVYIRSSEAGAEHYVVASTAYSIEYVNVQDSDACGSVGGGITASALTSTTTTNTTCWNFDLPSTDPTISSEASQTFALNYATTTISMITVTEPSTPVITAASDLRITIATSSVNMRFDTTDTTATFGGTAAAKVSNPVSYEGNGSVLVIPVDTNFSGGDTLTISDLSFSQFAAINIATSGLAVDIDGGTGATTTAFDDKTITITGSLVSSDHPQDQVSSNFTAISRYQIPLYRYTLTATGEDMTISETTFSLIGVNGITQDDLANFLLYRDNNDDGAYDAGDTQVGGTPTVSLGGQTGTVSFTTSYVASSTKEYLLIGDVAELRPGDQMQVTLPVTGLVATGLTTGGIVSPVVGAASIQHERPGMGSRGVPSLAPIGGDPPEGDGIRTGGGEDGGSGEIDTNTGGATLTDMLNFNAPTTQGSPQNSWINGANGINTDGSYARTATPGARHTFGGFGFNIPSNNTIVGIVVKIEASATSSAGGIDVKLSWDGGTSLSSTETISGLTTTDTVYTLGSAVSLWGHAWTPAEINNNFALEVIGNPSSNAVQIDAIRVQVYYQAAGGGQGGGGGEVRRPSLLQFATNALTELSRRFAESGRAELWGAFSAFGNVLRLWTDGLGK